MITGIDTSLVGKHTKKRGRKTELEKENLSAKLQSFEM